MMARGRVKFFNKEKGFGFFEASNGTEVFFHIKAYRLFKAGNGSMTFVEAAPKTPVENDPVVFIEMQGPKGAKAQHWTFAADLNKEGEAVPVVPGAKYRVRMIRVKDGKEEAKTLWKGNNPAKLIAKLPDKSSGLLPGSSMCVEVNIGDGWRKCEDFQSFMP